LATSIGIHHYKMWVLLINAHSLYQWNHYYPTSPHLLRPMNLVNV
jgi:hypothetical protein